ncbi:MAG: response regulator [Anaerolineales bacterium]|nr:response regulator [Anaerolineales bacterium]
MKEIWVVDDDDEMRRAVSLMLKLLGFNTKHYNNPRPAAEALLAGGRPDMLILDINMPEVTGLDILEFLRRRKVWIDLPVIMLSSEAADVMVDKALKLGADGYVMKPVTIEELEKVIQQAFSRHKMK